MANFTGNYNGKHFTTLHNGTSLALVSDDSNFTFETYPVEICFSDTQFEDFAKGEAFAAQFDGEYFVKVKVNEDDYEVMELSSANEYLAGLED